MSESQEPAPAGPSQDATEGAPRSAPPAAEARYPRNPGGLLGAMLVTVLAVVGFAAFRGVTRDNDPTPVRTVEYARLVKAARADKQLLVAAPGQLPQGWKATSATYEDGRSPTWHLGLLTDQRTYVGVEESRSSIEDLVDQHVDPDAEHGKDVTIAGETWQTWTDAGGDYAVARSLRKGGTTVESWLVVGTAPAGEIRDFAGALTYASEPPTG